jgi:tetratricopeptide (TPR) repeat protein
VNRRDFLRWLSSTATSLALPPTELDLDDGYEWLARTQAVPARLDHALLDRHMSANAAIWVEFGLATPKTAVSPLVQDQTRILTLMLHQSHSAAQRKRLCMLGGDLFQLAGEVFFDANRYSDAAQCYATAIDASKEGQSYDLWACAVVRQAFVAIYEHQFREALPLLEVASRVARRGDGTLSTRYWVHAVAAEAFAGTGDLVACQRALDRAEQVRALTGQVSNGGWLRFDGSRLAEQSGSCFARLQRPDMAEPALKEAMTLGLSARRRGLVLADLALVALQRDEIEEACSYGEAAAEIARLSASGVVTGRALDLSRQLSQFASLAAVKRFREHVASL